MDKKLQYTKESIEEMLKAVNDSLERLEQAKKNRNDPNILIKKLLKPEDSK